MSRTMRVQAVKGYDGVPKGTLGTVVDRDEGYCHVQFDGSSEILLVANRWLSVVDAGPQAKAAAVVATPEVFDPEVEESLVALATSRVQSLVLEAQQIVAQTMPTATDAETEIIVRSALKRTVGSVLDDLTNPDFDYGGNEVTYDDDLGGEGIFL